MQCIKDLRALTWTAVLEGIEQACVAVNRFACGHTYHFVNTVWCNLVSPDGMAGVHPPALSLLQGVMSRCLGATFHKECCIKVKNNEKTR